MIFFHFTRRKKKSGWNYCETLFSFKLFWSYLKLHFCMVPRVISWSVWGGRKGWRLVQYNLDEMEIWGTTDCAEQLHCNPRIKTNTWKRRISYNDGSLSWICDWIYTALVWIFIMFGYLWKCWEITCLGSRGQVCNCSCFLNFFNVERPNSIGR